MSTIRCGSGLIGGGRMGRTHLRALQDSRQVASSRVTEPFEAAAVRCGSRAYRCIRAADEMFAATALDGVLIAVPTPQHTEATRHTLAAGLPVLCEKPFGLQPDTARELGRLAAGKGLALQIGYWRRFVPALVSLRRELAESRYGTPHLLMCSQWDEAPPHSAIPADSGGIYIDMGVHEIDQTLWLLGQDFVDLRAQIFPTTEDQGAHNDVDSAQALALLSGGTSNRHFARPVSSRRRCRRQCSSLAPGATQDSTWCHPTAESDRS